MHYWELLINMEITNDKRPIKYKIVIADDHALVRGGLELVVKMAVPSAEIFQANNFDETINVLQSNFSIDLVLLDLMMPGMWHDSIKKITQQFPDVPIVIVSVKEDFDSIHNSISLGASGFIPKTSAPEVTISAIQLVLSGGVYIPPHVLNPQTKNISNNQQSNNTNTFDTLSKRQKQVLDLISLGRSNQAIADELDLTIPTIKMHVSAILKKLNVKNRTEAVSIYTNLEKVSDLIT
jgi:DNA-binding NarL/FixJ family response regulator